MTDEAICRPDFADLARDPLVRLVMASDGVTEAAFVAVLQTAKRAMDARSLTGGAVGRRRSRPVRTNTLRELRSLWA